MFRNQLTFICGFEKLGSISSPKGTWLQMQIFSHRPQYVRNFNNKSLTQCRHSEIMPDMKEKENA